MQRRRCVRAVLRAALAAAALLGAADAAAQVVPVRMYPLDASALKKADAGDAQALFEAGFARFERRARSFVPAEPLVLRRSCGARTTVDCLARLAGPGLVLTGTVTQSGGMLAFTLVGVDASGKVHGPVRVGIDAYISSAEPIARALIDLESRVELAPRTAPAPPPAVAQAPAAAAQPDRAAVAKADAAAPRKDVAAPALVTGAEPQHAPAAAPAARSDAAVATRRDAPTAAKDALAPHPGAPAAAGTPAAPSAKKPAFVVVLPPPPVLKEPPPRGLWLSPAGKWIAATGVGLLAASAATGYVGKRRSDALEAKYRDRGLSQEDWPAYNRIDQLGRVTNVLLVSGSIATAGGLALWAVAPTVAPTHGGAHVGVSGRF